MAWFVKYYNHDECDVEWSDEWSCACNDRCPVCDAEIEPYDWRNLSILIRNNLSGGYIVLVSAPEASDNPDYKSHSFDTLIDAQDFADRKRKELKIEEPTEQ